MPRKKSEPFVAEKADVTPVIRSFKGFDAKLRCRGHQFVPEVTYTVSGKVVACKNGWHACENPSDVLSYYGFGSANRFAIVEQTGDTDRHASDSKIASASITIKAELTIPQFVTRMVDYVMSHIAEIKKESAFGYQSAATNTGNQSAATNTGNRSAATNTGNQSAATNTGDQSAATNTGNRSAATNTGYQSAATNTGYRSAATNTGYRSAATNTGDQSAATNTGNQSAATNTGNRSAATNTGNQSAATNTGNRSAAEVDANGSVAIATGYEGRAKASAGSAICLVCRDDNMNIVAIRGAIVGQDGVKPDVWYRLNAEGGLVEVEAL